MKLNYIELILQIKKPYKYILLFIILSLSAATLDLIGIGALVGFIQLIISDNFSNYLLTYEFIKIPEIFYTNKVLALLFFSLFVLGFFILKNLLIFLINYIKLFFFRNVHLNLATYLYLNYLSMPFKELKNINSKDIIRSIVNDIDGSINGYFNSFIELISEIIVLVFILLFLFYLQPFITILIIFYFSFFLVLFSMYSNKLIYQTGKERVKLNSIILKLIDETFGSFREIIILDKIKYFKNKFNSKNYKYLNTSFKFNLFKLMPRLIIETLLISLIAIILFYSYYMQFDSIKIISILSIYGVSSLRLAPAFGRIKAHYDTLKYYKYAIDELALNLKRNSFFNNKNFNKNLQFKNTIMIKDLNYTYDGKNNIYQNFNFEIKKYSITGLRGKSGSGKTTFLDIISGLLDDYEGKIFLDNKLIKSSELTNIIGYVPQEPFIIDDSIEANIAFGMSKELLDQKKLNKIIENVNLTELINTLPDGLKSRAGERGSRLSGGQKQRIAIARILYHDNQILILDEPSSNIDKNNTTLLIDVLNHLKITKTILIVSHDQYLLDSCDSVYSI